ncbi:MAG: glycosyltransferase family 9 protein [Chitinophagaceae bacterium]|nr:MAG: glycosyltransferase family 9 protein [Chitinophagaceae bacterium]
MKILVRLPNWLGDMVMAVAFIEGLQQAYPGAEVHVIARKGIDGLLAYFPPLAGQYVFDKSASKGLRGLWRFGRGVRDAARFDLFFSLPDSLSSAVMGYATGARHRIGFRKEGRGVLLTHTYARPRGGHRVHEYLTLLERYASWQPRDVHVALLHSVPKGDHIAVNINSEAQSRRLTHAKAVELLAALRAATDAPLLLVGAPKEQAFVAEVIAALPDQSGIHNKAGTTTLTGLADLLAGARLVLSTDSGPAHLANALGTPTVVLFGAGNENNTAPFNSSNNTVLRLDKLSCEPCLKNRCVCFETPQCLERLETSFIIQNVLAHLS